MRWWVVLVLMLAACGTTAEEWRTVHDGEVLFRCNGAGWCYRP